MPNYCENKLLLHCTPAEYYSFVKLFFDKDGRFDFEKVIPSPSRKKDCPKEYIVPKANRSKGSDNPWFDWYHWRIDKWGTKWNSFDNIVCVPLSDLSKYDPSTYYDFEIYFTTAWSPAIPVIQKLIELCRSIYFYYSYFEGGCWFGGWLDNHNRDDNCISDDDLRQFSIDEGFRCEEDYQEEE